MIKDFALQLKKYISANITASRSAWGYNTFTLNGS